MITLKVGGMTCQHCTGHVRTALAKVTGVDSVEVDLKKGEARVSGTAKISELIAAVEGEGYSATEG